MGGEGKTGRQSGFRDLSRTCRRGQGEGEDGGGSRGQTSRNLKPQRHQILTQAPAMPLHLAEFRRPVCPADGGMERGDEIRAEGEGHSPGSLIEMQIQGAGQRGRRGLMMRQDEGDARIGGEPLATGGTGHPDATQVHRHHPQAADTIRT